MAGQRGRSRGPSSGRSLRTRRFHARLHQLSKEKKRGETPPAILLSIGCVWCVPKQREGRVQTGWWVRGKGAKGSAFWPRPARRAPPGCPPRAIPSTESAPRQRTLHRCCGTLQFQSAPQRRGRRAGPGPVVGPPGGCLGRPNECHRSGRLPVRPSLSADCEYSISRPDPSAVLANHQNRPPPQIRAKMMPL